MRLTWVRPEDLLAHEIAQSRDEGGPVDDVSAAWTAAGGDLRPPRAGASAPAVLGPLARTLLDRLDDRSAARRATIAGDAARSAAEPADLAGITALWRPPAGQPPMPTDDELLDRMHGAWLGRAAGCLLGKPVEKLPREGIRAIAQSTGNWPISGYFTAAGLDPAVATAWPWNRRSAGTSLVEHIDGMPEDDDLNYSLLALALLESHGAAVCTEDVAAAWLDQLPAGRVFTAERAVYRNLLDGVDPQDAAYVRNPFREWIGALIRADVYGWAHPGDPGSAARIAYADATLSHYRDGVYGAMFVAAMTAAALVGDDPRAAVCAGLAVVPEPSRLAGAVRAGVALADGGAATEDALDSLHATYGSLHWVHVVNNAAVISYAVAASPRLGGFGATIGAAVAAGWDTDSAAATVGGVYGAIHGRAHIPATFVEPLHNRVATSLPGFDGIGFDTLARRTLAVSRQLRAVPR